MDGDYLVNEEILKEVKQDEKIYELAVKVIFGEYGNGDERKQKLGDKYYEVQNLVNRIYEIVKR